MLLLLMLLTDHYKSKIKNVQFELKKDIYDALNPPIA